MIDALSHNPNGARDDGSPAGSLAVTTAIGDLIFQPFSFNRNVLTQVGGGLSAVRSSQRGNVLGSGGGIEGTVPAGITNYGALLLMFYGRRFALAVNRGTNAQCGVIIDGVAYRVPGVYQRWDTLAAGTRTISEVSFVPIADDLPDGEHQAEIVMPGGAGALHYELWGYGVERRAGYVQRANRPVAETPAYLTANANTHIDLLSAPSTYDHIRALHFANTDAAARTVYVAINGKTVYQVTLAAAGTAGSDDWFPRGGQLPFGWYNDGYIDAWADVANKVYCTKYLGNL